MHDKRTRILVVDDHDDTRGAVEKSLRMLGYEVASARTKSDALRLCESSEFDLLLGDLSLSDGSGIDLMRELAAKCKIKGIAYTGWGAEKDIMDARAAGFSAHLLKPVSFEALVKTIEKVLEGHSGGELA